MSHTPPRYIITVDGQEIDHADTPAAARQARDTIIYGGIGTEQNTAITPTATATATPADTWTPTYDKWRHGGWYVTNISYPTGGIGCVSRNYSDGKWRIVAENTGPGEPGDRTFANRDAAAHAERERTKLPLPELVGKGNSVRIGRNGEHVTVKLTDRGHYARYGKQYDVFTSDGEHINADIEPLDEERLTVEVLTSLATDRKRAFASLMAEHKIVPCADYDYSEHYHDELYSPDPIGRYVAVMRDETYQFLYVRQTLQDAVDVAAESAGDDTGGLIVGVADLDTGKMHDVIVTARVADDRPGLRLDLQDTYDNVDALADALNEIADYVRAGFTSGVYPHKFQLNGKEVPSTDGDTVES